MRKCCKVLILVLAAGSAVRADTIVLKSGRKISATEVHEEGNRFVYETPAGQMSVAKSMVDHVQRGPSAAFASGAGEGASVASAAVAMASAPPPVEAGSFDDVVKAVLAGGSIDRSYLLKLDGEASSGGKLVVERMAVGHHVAAQFELRKGEMSQAVNQYQRALMLAPVHVGLLLNLAYVQVRESQFIQALDSLERAKRIAPRDFDVAKLLGIAYYGANKMDQAVAEWKRALELRSDAYVQQKLAEVQRRQQEEAGYREGRSVHFQVAYSGAAAPPALVGAILRTLEAHFSEIESALNYSPREPIGVVLYTSQAYTAATGAPDWSGAVTDTAYSHISIPTQGLTGIDSELSGTLKHELTHAFIGQKTRVRCPGWMHEGVAQRMEGKNAGELAGQFVAPYDQRKMTIPLAELEAPSGAWSGAQAAVAYPWVLSVIEYIVSVGGMGDIERMLDHMATESPENAVKSVLHMDYSELEEQTIKYLRKTYVR